MEKGHRGNLPDTLFHPILQEAICRSSVKHGDEFSRFVAARELLSG
jgi:hypothetical protein